MNLSAALRARLSVPSGDELGQAILRIGLLSVVTLYAWWLRVPPWDEHDTILLTGLAGWLILAIGIFAAIWISPAANAPRRVLGILADAGAVTFGLFLAGESGAMLVGLYLFITFGNGFRYGRSYLFLCQFLCLTGFVLVELMVPWWRHHQVVAMGWMISMIVLPFYVGSLAERANAARVKAEEALKEYVEREEATSPE
jgi:two-component system, sensor histidine kinase RpfC